MVQLANMLFGMTITLANLVLPQMRGNLSATQEEISWVITLNLVATAVVTPMTGWLASRLGWRNLMFFTVLGFTATSLLCGMANSLESLILARVAQGAFGAPIMPLGQAILLATFPKHLQPMALVMWGIGAVFGPVAGPILGSIATEAYDWRAAFFMIVPPGICALVCIWFALRDHTARASVKFDWTGFIALSVAMTGAQLILRPRPQVSTGSNSTEMVLFAFVGALALWIFIVHCLTVPEPFLNPRLLLDRNFSIGDAARLCHGDAELRQHRAVSDAFARPARLPRQCHRLADRRARRRQLDSVPVYRPAHPRRPAVRHRLRHGACRRRRDSGWPQFEHQPHRQRRVRGPTSCSGLGQSIAFTPMTVMAFSTLPPRQVTEGSAVFTLMRNFGSSLFISIAVLTVSRSTASNYSRMTEFITPYNKSLSMPGLPPQWSLESPGSLQNLSNEILRQAAMIGYLNAFHLMAFVALGGDAARRLHARCEARVTPF